MKKVLSLVVLLTLMMSITAQAAGPEARMPSISPSLTFSGTTATCSGTVYADNASDSVSVVVKLWDGSICKGTWTGSGSGSARAKGSVTVTRGKTYKMTIDTTIKGVAQPRQSITRTCP